MARGGPFNSVKVTQPKRNYFDLSYTKLYSCGFSSLVPVMCQEVLPGDKLRIRNQSVVRMQPLVAPVLSEIVLYTEYFFVPNRIIWDDWEEFISGGSSGSDDPEYAHFTLVSGSYVTADTDSLADYLGLPVGFDTGVSAQNPPRFSVRDTMSSANVGGWLSKAQAEQISVLPFRAYQKIWNYYYRDENLQPDIDEDGAISSMSSFYDYNLVDIRYRLWHKDYFVGSLPWPQRGVEPVASFSGFAPVVNSAVPETSQLIISANTGLGRTSSGYNIIGNGAFLFPGSKPIGITSSSSSVSSASFYPLGVDMSAAGLSASDIRLLMQTQLFLERSARFGARLNEFLLAHFGVAPRDSVLQEPEYIGGTRSNVVVSEVLQTSASSLSDTPLGTQGGRGLGVSDGNVGTYTASEHGFVIGLASILPPRRLYEAQGVSKMWTRQSRYDYYFPEFAHLSEQPVKTSELMQRYNLDGDRIFGYMPIYSEYRSNQSFAAGQMRHFARQSLDYWTLGTYFSDGTSGPFLNSNFVTPDVSQLNKIFQVQDEDGFIVHFRQIIDAWRPMPSVGLPLSLVRF